MKRVTAILAVFALALAFAIHGMAAEKPKHFTGEVKSVDATAKTIVVKGKTAEETFDVAQATFKGYKDLSEVAQGDKVRVSYVETEGKKVAKTVAKVGAAKAAKPAAPGK